MKKSNRSLGRKEASYNVYIPENLDLEEQLKQYPLGISNAKDKVAYFLHLIYAVRAYKKEYTEYSSFTILHSTYLQNRIRDYLKIIEWLQKRDIIIVDNQYLPAEKSRGYKFSLMYQTELKVYEITCYTLIKNILKRIKKETKLQPEHVPGFDPLIYNNSGQTYSEIAENMLSYLKKWLNEKLVINTELAEQHLKHLQEKEALTSSPEKAIDKFNLRLLPLKDFNTSNRFTVDGTAGRLHTKISNLKSQLRCFVTYDDKQLVSVDIKNTQPLLSLALMSEELLIKNRMLERMDINRKPTKNREEFRQEGEEWYTMLVNFVRNNSHSADVLQYKELVVSGKIYEYFGDLLAKNGLVKGNTAFLRKFAKQVLIVIYFSSNKTTSTKRIQKFHKCRKVFEQAFPTVSQILKMIKADEHSTLACVLQNLEAEIVLHRACKEIAAINPDIPIITIHDSIATLPEHLPLVKEVLIKHLYETLNVEPTIKIEAWNETLLNEQGNEELITEAIPQSNIQVKTAVNHQLYGYATDEPEIFLYSMAEAAKTVGLKRNKLMAGLRALSVIGSGLEKNKPIEYYVTQGYLQYAKWHNRGKISYTPKVTDAGIDFLKGIIAGHPEMFS